MKLYCILLLLFSSFSTLYADQAAETILAHVRHGAILQNNDLSGDLKKEGKRHPIHLFLRENDIQFLFNEGKKQDGFHMRLGESQFDLFEIVQRKVIPMPADKLDDPIKGTDVTYEDLAMQFLYWPDSSIVGEEKVKSQNCYKIRLENPDQKAGKYKIVYAWVHKKYNALMKVIGYNAQGKPLKRFVISELQKSGDMHTLKKMEVSTLQPDTNKVTGVTYLEFDKPRPVNKSEKPLR